MKTFCHYYNLGTCRSCNRLEHPYEEQLALKDQKLSELFESFGPFDQLAPVASSPVGFRNKAKISITGTLESPIVGLTGTTELDLGRELLDCPLHVFQINDVLKALPAFIRAAKLPPYKIAKKTGEIKGAILYYSPESNEMYLRLILRSKESIDRIRKHASLLLTKFDFMKCLSVNIQPIPHAVLEGEEEVFITPQDFIHHKIGSVDMTLHPQGFVQTNQQMALKLYSTAAAWVRELRPKTFLELFSGQGAFSFFIQEFVEKAVGVEINREAVDRANQTALRLNYSHLRFIAQDAAQVSQLLASEKPDVILVNPPRKGLGRAVDLFKGASVKHVLYSSCDPETLAQDLEVLRPYFRVIRAQVFDMFPNTDHFEVLVLLTSTSDGRSA